MLGAVAHRTTAHSTPWWFLRAELSAIPTVLYGTINGVIGVIASLPHATYQLLESLQVG